MQNRVFANEEKPKFSPQRKVLLFSVLFFFVILAGGSAAFLIVMRQIVRNDTFSLLSRIIETKNLRFTTAFESQINLAVNMAESPLIRTHIGNPGNAELARLARSEFNANRKSFSGNNIFWISDIDKRYYFNNEYSYTLDTADPANDWYAPTLNQKERFSFNVNFDIGIKRTLCWINVPVYDDNKTPVGIVGTGIDLTDYINILFKGLGEDVTLLLFNGSGEITGAKDISLMEKKATVFEVWEAGRQVLFEAQSSGDDEVRTFIIGNKAYAVSKISRLNWYIAVSQPVTIFMFLNNTVFVFIALIAVILFIFVIFNVYISNILRPINLMLERMRNLSAEWKNSSHNLRIRQIVFVCFAFILMIVISFSATNIILRSHLTYEAQELLRVAELTIASNLREAMTTLVDSSFTMRYLIERGESQENLRRYMVDVTNWLMGNNDLVYGFNGLYGYIRGDYLDGTNWEPPPDYVPRERPWFAAAMEKRGELAETVPYVDAQSGEIVISYSHELFDASGKSLGVLSIDVLLDQVGEYVENIRLSKTGYGILVNQNFEVLACPDTTHRGKRLDSIKGDYNKIQAMLSNDRLLTAFSVIDSGNIKHIAFFKRLYNGWYIGSMTPADIFYKDMYIMSLILTLVGSALMFILSLLISRQHRRIESYTEAVIQLNEASRRFVPTQFVKIIGVENITSLKLGDSVHSVITVMFFDIRFFSVHSQMMSTNEIFDFVNKIFGLAGTIIKKNNGFVDKYLGDSAMVLFERAGDAVRAGIEIYRTLILNETTRITNGIDGINIGIGAHTGDVMMGVIGDTEHYASTVISKHVNTASRIEGLTKQLKAGMLISADLMQQIPDNERDFSFRYLGMVNPALSRETIGLFEILDVLPDDVRERRLKTREFFESAVRNFLTENYLIAAGRFKEVIDLDASDESAKLFYNETKAHIEGRDRRTVFSFDTK
jgi:class 3 adenylate cyclase